MDTRLIFRDFRIFNGVTKISMLGALLDLRYWRKERRQENPPAPAREIPSANEIFRL